MDAFSQYRETLQDLVSQIDQFEVERAAKLLAEAIKDDRLIFVLGTDGHAYMAAEEMFWRPGGLVPIRPILPAGFALAHGARRSTLLERTENYVKAVLDYEDLKPGDVLILVNSYGINASSIEAASKAKEMGAKVVAITSSAFGRNTPLNHPARHASRENLYDMELDIVIDNKMPTDDAVLSFPGMDVNVAAVSSILNLFVIQALVACTVEKLLSEDIKPPVWKSVNLPGGEEYNEKHLEDYTGRIRSL